LGIALVTGIVGTLIWVLAGEVCDARQAKRLFAVFASAGILGSMLAGFLTGPMAAVLGTETLLLVSAALLIASAAVARGMLARFAQPARRGLARSSPVRDLQRAHHIVFSNTTMRLTAIGAVLFSVLFFTVSFPFSVEAAGAFPDEAELAGFLGTFGGIVTGVTFAVSLLLASRVLARIGLINSVLLLPLAYLAGFVLWAIRLDLSTAVFVRFVQLVLLGGLAGTAFNALFNVIPADQRSQVRAYQAGPPAQLGVMLSGVLILLSQRGLTSSRPWRPERSWLCCVRSWSGGCAAATASRSSKR
jgi:ATP/ADP translocase